jgi:hypothetical protein
MKTAMQIFIDNMEAFVKELDEKYDGDPLVKRGVLIAINEAKLTRDLEEKFQITAAYDAGKEQPSNSQLCPIDYYNRTYQNTQSK